MILFVFEGQKRETDIFRTLEYLHFNKEQAILCSFRNNIYELYRQLSQLDGAGDIVSLLRELNEGKPDNPFRDDMKSSDFSEVYLFFDYDFQNKNLSLEEMNNQISDMLAWFDNETENGKLYINYPMVEAIRYTKTLPDPHYIEYVVSKTDCHDKGFKDMAEQFSDYHSLDFIVFDTRKPTLPRKIDKVRKNWELLEMQNVVKANYLCNKQNDMPADKYSISQQAIFEAQLTQFIKPKEEVAILCAFPLFSFEYFKH